MSIIDLRDQKDPAENVIKIINATAEAKIAKLNLEKELMLDDIKRSRDIRDKGAEIRQKNQLEQEATSNWFNNMPGMSANGIANSTTPPRQGSSPLAKISMPQQTTQPAMSLESGGVGDVYGNEINTQQVEPTQQGQVQSQPTQRKAIYKGLEIAHPMDLYRQEGKPTPWVRAYASVWNKLSQGQPISEAEASIVEDVNKIKLDKSRGSASLENAKNKRTSELLDTLGDNSFKQDSLNLAQQALQNIDAGVFGKIKRDVFKVTDPNNPLYEDWQKIKMVLTDSQLMYTAKTKGAISDREMELFSKAAANDDIFSLYAVKPALDRLQRLIDTQNDVQIKTYKRIYKEDPLQWQEVQDLMLSRLPGATTDQGTEVPTFASEEEAMAANPPIGSIIIINGQKVRVEE